MQLYQTFDNSKLDVALSDEAILARFTPFDWSWPNWKLSKFKH